MIFHKIQNALFDIKRRKNKKACLLGIYRFEKAVQKIEKTVPKKAKNPIIFFNPSAQVSHIGLSTLTGLLAAWSLRLSGYPVLYFVCKKGMTQCVLGSNRKGIYTKPPCENCLNNGNSLYPHKYTLELNINEDQYKALRRKLNGNSWNKLVSYGKLCFPSLRWVERRNNLKENEFRRKTLIEFIISGKNISIGLKKIFNEYKPAAMVLFNATHYPEAIAYACAKSAGIKTVTYEAGYRNLSAFFSHDIATKYEIEIPKRFKMGKKENMLLDKYLLNRQKGNLYFGGRKVTIGMNKSPASFKKKIKKYKDIVSVYTNVAWDTSQQYAHVFFRDLFDWLETTLKIAEDHQNTLFVVRCHPDEDRAGKASNEQVKDWMAKKSYLSKDNVYLVAPNDQISSYELVKLSKFCLVYNSNIGLEASCMGKFVITGGWARYRNANVSFEINNRKEYIEKLNKLLKQKGAIKVKKNIILNARRYLYFSIYKASLDLSKYLEYRTPPDVMLKNFNIKMISPEKSPEFKIIKKGIISYSKFY